MPRKNKILEQPCCDSNVKSSSCEGIVWFVISDEMDQYKTATTYYLFLIDVAWAVSGCEGGGAGLAVPGDIAILCGAADGEGVDAVGVAITVAAVLLPSSVPWCPNKDGAQTATTLEKNLLPSDTCERRADIPSFNYSAGHHYTETNKVSFNL